MSITDMNKHPLLALMISVMLIFCINLSAPAAAWADGWFKGSDYHFHTKDESMFDLTVTDVKYPFNWVGETKTWTCSYIDPNDGAVSWYWNAPNLQQLCWNTFYGLFAPSGYVGSTDESQRPAKYSSARTASQKFGYHIPAYAYVGEYPRITMDFTNVVIPENIFEAGKTLWSGLTGGSVVNDASDQDLKTMRYIAPNDYASTRVDLVSLMADNWNAIEKWCQENDVHAEVRNENGGKVKWVFPDDVDVDQLQNQASRSQYAKKLKIKLGTSYEAVAKDILAVVAEVNPDAVPQGTIRVMPWELENLAVVDADQLGFPDPRAVMQEQTVGQMGLENQIAAAAQGIGLSFNAYTMESASMMNGICSFDFLDESGIDTGMLWMDSILNLFIPIAVAGFVLLCVKGFFQAIRGKSGFGRMMGSIVSALLALLLFIGVTAAKEPTMELIKTTGEYAFNLGSITADYSPAFKKLYTDDAKMGEKAELRYWVCYFAPWTKYQTGSDLSSASNALDKQSGLPEQKLMDDYPTLKGGKTIDLWSAVLADSFWRPGAATGNGYRVVDHFIAPRVHVVDAEKASVTTTPNENYKGWLQSSFDWGYMVSSIVIWLLTLVKVLCFAECIIRIMLFIINLAIRSTGFRGSMWDEVKSLVISFLRVGVVDIMITIQFMFVMSMDSTWVGIFSLAMLVTMVIIVQALRRSRSMWKPQWLGFAEKAVEKARGAVTDIAGMQDSIEGAIAVGRTMMDDRVISKRLSKE